MSTSQNCSFFPPVVFRWCNSVRSFVNSLCFSALAWLRFSDSTVAFDNQQACYFGSPVLERLTFLVELPRAHPEPNIIYISIRSTLLTRSGFYPGIKGLYRHTSGIVSQLLFLLDRRAQVVKRISQLGSKFMCLNRHLINPYNIHRPVRSSLRLNQLNMS